MNPEDIFNGHEFYDQEAVFDRYNRHRARSNNPNDLIEKPIVLELLDGVSGHVLDLGCGDGRTAETLIASRIQRYTGIDASAKMIAQAKERLSSMEAEWIECALEEFEYGRERYDWMISRLVFHYVNDLESLFSRLYAALKPRGRFVFSVEHPVITSSLDLPHASDPKTSWVVDQYFQEGPRAQEWMGAKVEKYHRSLETWWQIINRAGFEILEIREGRPETKHFQDPKEFARRMRIPMFLIFLCKKE